VLRGLTSTTQEVGGIDVPKKHYKDSGWETKRGGGGKLPYYTLTKLIGERNRKEDWGIQTMNIIDH